MVRRKFSMFIWITVSLVFSLWNKWQSRWLRSDTTKIISSSCQNKKNMEKIRSIISKLLHFSSIFKQCKQICVIYTFTFPFLQSFLYIVTSFTLQSFILTNSQSQRKPTVKRRIAKTKLNKNLEFLWLGHNSRGKTLEVILYNVAIVISGLSHGYLMVIPW